MNSFIIAYLPALLVALTLAVPVKAEEDFDFDAFERIDNVNEGQLMFLTQDTQNPVHHHQNHITILPDSLVSGWVILQQCHQHLDSVSRAQVVYNAERTRNLKVESSSGIDAAWVENNTIQVQGIHSNASLCVSAQTRAFWPDEQGGFTLYNGPYMRQFLDGYYPMRVTLNIAYPEQLLSFRTASPEAQPGFHIDNQAGSLTVQALFEGRLTTQLSFDHSL
jgi:hypothetical protein